MYEFPKDTRLLKATEYTLVLQRAELNLSSGPLRVRAIRNRMPRARLGLVVPKRGTPKAHHRNRIKRLIREDFRHAAPGLPGVDLVVQVFGELDESRLRAELGRMFDRISMELS